jgi:CRP-like cAMP-binding protein
MMEKLNARFEIDSKHLHSLGVLDPGSNKSLEIYETENLNSNERLYFSLWGCRELNSTSFDARSKIFNKGSEITCAYFIVSGTVLSVSGQLIKRLGPGSVIGLAEGISGLNSPITVIAVTSVQARVIPISKISHILPKLPKIMQKIIGNIASRSLEKIT